MVVFKDLRQISEFEWEIPQSFREDMRVPVRLFATRKLLEKVMEDKSLEQAVNAATLPGLVGHVVVMPDMHQGYGFPIGGVAATKLPDGVISPGGIGYDINCLAGSSEILHKFGYTRRIDAMDKEWPTSSLACFDLDEPQLVYVQPKRWFSSQKNTAVYRLTTELGYSVTATGDHPLFTPGGMISLEELTAGKEVAIYAFAGLPYEKPQDAVIVSEEDFTAYLRSIGKSENGNGITQILNHLRSRNLLPLTYSSPAVPYLCKILGFVFGDGNVRFDRKTGHGFVSFYGKPGDLEDICCDIQQLGFEPSQIWSRKRRQTIHTTYRQYNFDHEERWINVNSTSFAALLSFLGAPLGNKARQDYDLPAWLDQAPLWQKRLFLAAFFGAEMSSPQTVSGASLNLAAPTVSMNKRESNQDSGRKFLLHIGRWLEEMGIKTQPLGYRLEQRNKDGSQSVRLRLIVTADPENLLALWTKVGFEYNHKRRILAAIAAQYLKFKDHKIKERQAAADQAVELKQAGIRNIDIYAKIQGTGVNQRFIERTLMKDRKGKPRPGDGFLTFEEYKTQATVGLGESGMTWDRIKEIEQIEFDQPVYDFTMDFAHHNFVANQFVVSNCGVRLLSSQVTYEQAQSLLDDLASSLNRHCPSGVGSTGEIKLNQEELDRVCREGSRWAKKRGYAADQDLIRTEEGGGLEGADPARISKRARERGQEQMGTLGAGNHFIEVDLVDQVFDLQAAQAMGLAEGNLVVQIHCGSRGFGHQVCTDYVEEFQNAVRKYNIKLPDRELVCAPLNSPEGESYLAAMRCAANYAFANRQVLAHNARQAFEEVLAGVVKNWHLSQVYDIAHNMGKIETHQIAGKPVKVCVHRKGATRAFGPGAAGLPPEYSRIGQPVLVPGSMGTASWVLVGTQGSMDLSFGSSCHGAGRLMSRARAKKEVRGDHLRKTLEQDGIHVRAGSLSGLAEEAPSAYKDVDAVVETVSGAGIAKKVARLVPVAVIKG